MSMGRTLAVSATGGRVFSVVYRPDEFRAESEGRTVATSPTLLGLLEALDEEHRAVLPFDPEGAAELTGEPGPDAARVALCQRRLDQLVAMGAPDGVIAAARADLYEARERVAGIPEREEAVPVRLRGAAPPGPPEIGVWVGYDGRVLTQRAEGLRWAHAPAILDRGASGVTPASVQEHPPQAWPLRTVWNDPHADEDRFIAIFAETPRWGLDPDGVRALEGIAMLDLETGEWLTEIPARMQVCGVRVPAVVAEGRLAWFHLATGIVTVEDAAGPIEAWDPLWRTVDGGVGGRVANKPIVEVEVGLPFDVGGPGASRPRRGTAWIHAHWRAGVVVSRDGVVASTREAVMPRLVGDLVAVGFSPNFDAPVVMTGADVRFLRWVEVDEARFDLAVQVTMI